MTSMPQLETSIAPKPAFRAARGLVLATALLLPPAARGEYGTAPIAQEVLRKAAGRGLKVVEKAARSYPEHRDCFSCHHQTLPMLAMEIARERGLPADR